jgi:hypothetical protein
MTTERNADLLDALDKFKRWNDVATRICVGIDLKDGLRSYVAGTLFHLSMGHSIGIATLIHSDLTASALALYRSQLEGYVRGLWIMHCATDEQIERFANGDDSDVRNFTTITDAIDKKTGTKHLSKIRNSQWKTLNDFTHGGAIQVNQRIATNVMQSNYDDKLALRFFRASTNLSVLTATNLMVVMDRGDLAQELNRQFDYIFPPAWGGTPAASYRPNSAYSFTIPVSKPSKTSTEAP